MSVTGIDFGNQNCYISVARQGGIETVINDYSLRATPSCVAFGHNSRSMGTVARQKMLTNIRNTVFGFKNLLGRNFSDPVVQREMQWLPYTVIELPGNEIGIQVEHAGEARVFTPIQVMAALFTKLKEITEMYLKAKVYDCVLSVPCFWTDAQRRAMLDAARVADLNCLRLINETISVALNYGLYKTDLPKEDEEPRKVCFFDMGHTSSQAYICAFNKGQLKMLGIAWDMNLGGRDFDDVLCNYFAEQFKAQRKVDIRNNRKSVIKMLDACEKLKKQMSADPNEIPISVESLAEDYDFYGKMRRKQFEELSIPLFNKVEALLARLLKETGVSPDSLFSVELVGGSTRLPLVKSIVAKMFGREPNTTLNQDEAVSRGCAIECAILSPTFRVREFTTTDIQPYAITLSWSGSLEDENETEVFQENHQFPFTKMLTFYRKEPFTLEAKYSYPNHIPYPNKFIGRYLIKDVVPCPDGTNSKVKVKVRISQNGLFAVPSATILEEKEREGEKASEGVSAETNHMDEDNVTSTSAEKMEVEDNTTENPGEAAQGENAASKEPANDEEENKQESQRRGKGGKQKIKYKSVALPVIEVVHTLSNDEFQKYHKAELELQLMDRAEMEKADAKNAVEEYVYDLRGKLTNELEKFIKKQDCENFMNLLNNTETWLYEEGDDMSKEVYQEKLRHLKNVGDPVVERYREYMERPVAFQQMNELLNTAKNALTSYLSQDEKYSHWESADVEKLRKAIDEKERWYQEQMTAQARRPLTEPPAVFVHQIKSESQAFQNATYSILNKPKPALPKKEPANVKPKQTPQSTANAAEEPQELFSEPTPNIEEVD